MKPCESCREQTATTRSTNPDYSGYNLCEECAEEYNGRSPMTEDAWAAMYAADEALDSSRDDLALPVSYPEAPINDPAPTGSDPWRPCQTPEEYERRRKNER